MIAIAIESRVSECVDAVRPNRTGSLRPIGDIVGELLSGYDLRLPAATAELELAYPELVLA